MSETKELRVDIQALRGFAVLAVVLYHARLGILNAGYLGVDVFFVISGFLITTLVASGISRGDFSLMEFYFRRAKRLLPAAYVTLLVTAILAPWFLDSLQLHDFTYQVVGAVTFTGNFVFWQQTGYFEGASDLKPLLHIWSLSIEEQYYFILPTALLLSRPSRWLPGIIAVGVFSLILCLAGTYFKPIATFYLLPTRAWELLVGSVAALWAMRARTRGFDPSLGWGCRFLFAPAVLGLVVLPFIPGGARHPGLNVLLICLATAVVILRNSAWLNRSRVSRILARVGDFSYSLYLVHWPVFAFLKNVWIGSDANPPLSFRVAAIIVSLVLAWLLYRFVESPIHRTHLTFTKPLMIKTALASVVLSSISPALTHAKQTGTDFAGLDRSNFGLSMACGEYLTSFHPIPECRSGPAPSLLVWGDSFAMHLVAGLKEEWESRGGIVQATKSQCGPFHGMAPRERQPPDQGFFIDTVWARNCIAFNQSVMDYLRNAPSIKVVILSSVFVQYVTRENFDHVVEEGGDFLVRPADPDDSRLFLLKTIAEIQAMGKRVAIIAPPPVADFDIASCHERHISHMIALGGPEDCSIERKNYEARQEATLRFLHQLEKDVPIIWFDDWLCHADKCATLIGNTIIYRDRGHLSYAGSVLVAKGMHLGQLLEEQAH